MAESGNAEIAEQVAVEHVLPRCEEHLVQLRRSALDGFDLGEAEAPAGALVPIGTAIDTVPYEAQRLDPCPPVGPPRAIRAAHYSPPPPPCALIPNPPRDTVAEEARA